MTAQDAARQRAIEALAPFLVGWAPDKTALDDHVSDDEWAAQWGPSIAGSLLDYLDAHPEAKAALAAWLVPDRQAALAQCEAQLNHLLATQPPPGPDEPRTDDEFRERACPACGAALAPADTHWNLTTNAYECPTQQNTAEPPRPSGLRERQRALLDTLVPLLDIAPWAWDAVIDYQETEATPPSPHSDNPELGSALDSLIALCNRDIEGQFEEATGLTFDRLRAALGSQPPESEDCTCTVGRNPNNPHIYGCPKRASQDAPSDDEAGT